MGLYTKALKKSLWAFHVPASGCNNCDIEAVDALTPRFDVERFGIKLVGSPRHADALLITGPVSAHCAKRVEEAYKQMSKPCVVVCIGVCACSMGVFRDAYSVAGPPDKIIKAVDPDAIIAYIPGCPPKPETIIAGIVKALGTL